MAAPIRGVYRAIDILFVLSEIGAEVPERISRRIAELATKVYGANEAFRDVTVASLKVAEALKASQLSFAEVRDVIAEAERWIHAYGWMLGDTYPKQQEWQELQLRTAAAQDYLSREIELGRRQLREHAAVLGNLRRQYYDLWRTYYEAAAAQRESIRQQIDALRERIDVESLIHARMEGLYRVRKRLLWADAQTFTRTGRRIRHVMGDLYREAVEGLRAPSIEAIGAMQRLASVMAAQQQPATEAASRAVGLFSDRFIQFLDRVTPVVMRIRQLGTVTQDFIRALPTEQLNLLWGLLQHSATATGVLGERLAETLRPLVEQEFATRSLWESVQRMRESLTQASDVLGPLVEGVRRASVGFRELSDPRFWVWARTERDFLEALFRQIVLGTLKTEDLSALLRRFPPAYVNQMLEQVNRRIQSEILLYRDLDLRLRRLAPRQRELVERWAQVRTAMWRARRELIPIMRALIRAHAGEQIAQRISYRTLKEWATGLAFTRAHVEANIAAIEKHRGEYEKLSPLQRAVLRDFARNAMEAARKQSILAKHLRSAIAELYDSETAAGISARQYYRWARQLLVTTDAFDDNNRRFRRFNRFVGELGDRLYRAGWRVGFFGWIISYTGRSIVRTFEDIRRLMEDLLRTGADWVDNIQTIATALALGQRTGLLTADAFVVLQRALQRQLEFGLEFQALWLMYQSLLIEVKTAILAHALPAFVELLNWLLAFVRTEQFRAFLEQLTGLIFALVPVLQTAVSAFLRWFPIVAPLVYLFAQLMAQLSPFAPLLMIIGGVLHFIGPLLTLFGSAIRWVATNTIIWATYNQYATVSLLGLTVSARTAQIAILGLIAAVTVAGAVLLLWAHRQVTPTFRRVSEIFRRSYRDIMSSTVRTTRGIRNYWSQGLYGTLLVSRENLEQLRTEFEDRYGELVWTTSFAVFSAASLFEEGVMRIVDSSGDLIYEIDLLTGKVYDASGEWVGSFDSATGEIRNKLGELIAKITETGTVVETETGEQIGSVENWSRVVSETLPGIAATFDRAATDMTEALSSVESAFGDLEDALADLESQFESINNVTRAFTEVSLVAIAARIHPLLGLAVGLSVGLYEIYQHLESTRIEAGRAAVMLERLEGDLAVLEERVPYSTAEVRTWMEQIKAGGAATEEAERNLREFLQTLGYTTTEIEYVIRALREACFRHLARDVRVLTRELQPLNEALGLTTAHLGGIQRGLPRIPGGYTSINVYTTVSIGTVTAEVDVDALMRQIDEQVVESVRHALER